MESYDIFSKYYDIFTENVDYKSRTEHICEVFERYDRLPSLLLDVGCGSGNFTSCFYKKGIDVIGVDISEGMLSIAKEKAEKENQNILYLNQSADELDLYGTVDGAVCLLDTVNHIVNKRQLQASFNKISLFLEKDRLFVFDVNTEYKQSEILGNNTFVLENEQVYLVWQNFWDKARKISDIELDFFEKENGGYKRETVSFCERVYTRAELAEMLKKAGLKLIAVHCENGFSTPNKTSQRNVYVARKE